MWSYVSVLDPLHSLLCLLTRSRERWVLMTGVKASSTRSFDLCDFLSSFPDPSVLVGLLTAPKGWN